LGNYETNINLWWILSGIVVALQKERHDEALARALAGLGAIEQFSIDGGSWLVALEVAMIQEPPYHSFAGRANQSKMGRPLTHSRLVDPKIHEMFQNKIKASDEAVERKKRLTKRGAEEAPPKKQ